MKIKNRSLFLLLISSSAFSQSLHFKAIETNTKASFRGLSVVDDSVAWASGSNGWVGHSTNGGNSWSFKQVPGYEKMDFRSLYAFDANTALIANAGSPAHILITQDGGQHWSVVYTNINAAAFFDGMGFWNDKEGIIYGDPIDGHLTILRTHNGGLHWEEIPQQNRSALAEGEASFAASGTTIRCMGKQNVMIATGGKVSRLLISKDKGLHWNAQPTPMLQGQKSTGIFSFAYWNDTTGIIVGGDYLRDSLATDHVFYTKNGGKRWITPAIPTRGYRECVEYITEKRVIATGPTGTDISDDGGIHWQPLSDEKGFHVVKKALKGKMIIIAGGKGKIALIPNPSL